MNGVRGISVELAIKMRILVFFLMPKRGVAQPWKDVVFFGVDELAGCLAVE